MIIAIGMDQVRLDLFGKAQKKLARRDDIGFTPLHPFQAKAGWHQFDIGDARRLSAEFASIPRR